MDLSSEESITERVDTIRGELAAYETPLDGRPWILVGTKIDAVADRLRAEAELAGWPPNTGLDTVPFRR